MMTPEVSNDRHRPALKLDDAVCLATNTEPAQENTSIFGCGSDFLTPPVVSDSLGNPKRKRQELNILECPIAPGKRYRRYRRKLLFKDLPGFTSGPTDFIEDNSSIVAHLSRAPFNGTAEDLCVNLSLYFDFEKEDDDDTSGRASLRWFPRVKTVHAWMAEGAHVITNNAGFSSYQDPPATEEFWLRVFCWQLLWLPMHNMYHQQYGCPPNILSRSPQPKAAWPMQSNHPCWRPWRMGCCIAPFAAQCHLVLTR